MIQLRHVAAALAAGSLAAAAEPARDLSFVAYPASPEALVAEFPTVEANGAAKELEKLAASLGIDLAPRSIEGRVRPAPEAKNAYGAVRSELEAYVVGELEEPALGVPRIPPLSVDRYLDAHRETLDAVRELLTRGPHPRWDRNLEKAAGGVLPNLLGHICLHKLLIADALAMEAGGNHRAALASLDASWALNTALRDEPETITQLIAVSVARLEAGALRRIPGAGDEWSKRLRDHDYRRTLLRGMALEGFRWTRISTPPGEQPGGWMGKIAQAAGKPYARLCLDETAERWKDYLESLARTDSLCVADLPAMERVFRDSAPWWNLASDKVAPGSASGLERVARLELDVEMTSRILEIEAVRAKTGAWPRALPRGEDSSACPGTSFVYEIEEDGTMLLALDREPRWSFVPSGTLVLPTRYVRSP